MFPSGLHLFPIWETDLKSFRLQRAMLASEKKWSAHEKPTPIQCRFLQVLKRWSQCLNVPLKLTEICSTSHESPDSSGRTSTCAMSKATKNGLRPIRDWPRAESALWGLNLDPRLAHGGIHRTPTQGSSFEIQGGPCEIHPHRSEPHPPIGKIPTNK